MMKKSKYIALISFFVFFFLGLFTIKEESDLSNTFFRVISLLSLTVYYVLSVKNKNFYFVLALITFLISDAFFSINSSHLLGVIGAILSRSLLIKIIIPDCKNADKKSLFFIIILMTLLCGVLLYFYYEDTILFYTAAFACLTLAILTSLTFSVLLENKKRKKYIAMFLGISLFIISDAFFGIQKINERETEIMLSDRFTVLLYYIGYFFICITMIKKGKEILKLNDEE